MLKSRGYVIIVMLLVCMPLLLALYWTSLRSPETKYCPSAVTIIKEKLCSCEELICEQSVLVAEQTEPIQLASFFTQTTKVLEWGNSGLFAKYSEKVESWHSVTFNQTLRNRNNTLVLDCKPQWESGADSLYDESHRFKDYVYAPLNFSRQFDVAIVGSEAPRDCAISAVEMMRTNNSVVIMRTQDRQLFGMLDCFELISETKQFSILKPHTTFRIIVLTWRRPSSLQRLLESLNEADYLFHSVSLEIHIDFDAERTEDWRKTIEIAKGFTFKFGPTTVLTASQPGNLVGAWWNAWPHPMQCGGRAIILEDDLKVSKFWFKYVTIMWNSYARRNDMAGITLQRLATRATDSAKIEVYNAHQPFLYKMFGSWGFSPSARRWQQFMDLVHTVDQNTFNFDVPGIVTTSWGHTLNSGGTFWESIWIWMAYHLNLYTLYLTPPNQEALASNFREKGAHYFFTAGADFPCLSSWLEAWDSPPEKLAKYSWNGALQTTE